MTIAWDCIVFIILLPTYIYGKLNVVHWLFANVYWQCFKFKSNVCSLKAIGVC